MNSFLKSQYFKIFLAFLAWRVFLCLVAAVAPSFIPVFGAKFPYYQELLVSSGLPHFVWSFANFDGVHYLRIANHLYDYQYTQAFFPLYPLIIRFVSFIFFKNLIISGLFVSNAFFLAGLFIFFNLVSEFKDKKTAWWSIAFILTFPTSFYLGAVYTEGFFFFLIIFSFYLLAKNHSFWASVFGAFASATRLVGIFLSPALLKGKKVKDFIPVLIVPSGLFIYMSYLFLKFKNPFYFLTAQTIFGQGRSTTSIVLLPQVFYRYLKILLTTHGMVLASSSFELISTMFALAILILATKKSKPEWLIFSWLSVLLPTLTGTLISMPRYILIAFPMFVYLAQVKSKLVKILLLTVFCALLVISTALFTQGYWVA